MAQNLLVLLSIYMIYTNTKMLSEVAVLSWQLEHYLLVLITLGFAVLFFQSAKAIMKRRNQLTND